MAKILGINALAYINGIEIPERNEWSLSIKRELQEARVFQAATAGSSWVDQSAGFRSWSGSLNGYFDNAVSAEAQSLVYLSIGHFSTASTYMLLYESRATLKQYWYGIAWFEISQTTGVDNFVELNCDFTGNGALLRFHTT
jgi:hypothetical protein